MNIKRIWSFGLGMLALVLTCSVTADVYKYTDDKGNVIFSDVMLTNTDLQLEWKRSNHTLVANNQAQLQELVASRRAAQLLEQQTATAAAVARARQLLAQSRTPTVPAPPSATVAARRAYYHHLIERTANQYGLWPSLLHAVIRTESNYRADALSSAGACGLMQLMPDTAARFKVRDIWDPAENIRGGASYLRWLLDLFQNDLRLALAGYNAGENAVKRYGYEIPPYPETVGYVRKVLQFLRAERESVRS
ncbi:lytic transglycosylase domain-containing protein [Rhodoferax sp. 4810]|uniref:Lytic transglycosylase domain-containing protein n=1 Tax=Thiospirillum jenense TaxID=1653858 RepID=A0A839HFV2_9GAMM|nr:lytic transglycosylase domain-containing protein [Thiospirillum jenense]MBB1073519.1 lytic transglycosylase domain-containing protein [Rhodoferax jenense]MBB1126007.1 lytic transglycosylase domain-containing protein [Thiospirillum jenense]